MNALIIYQLKVGFSIALFTSLYYFLLRKETFYLYNRLYLLISLLISLLLPLIKFSQNSFDNPRIFNVIIDSVTVYADNFRGNDVGKIHLSAIEWIYFSVSAFYICYTIYQFVYIFLAVKKNGIIKIDKYRIVKHPGGDRSFSFFNLIFVSSYDSSENDLIMIHEMTHVKQKHSYDLLFIQIIKVFQWFNPFIYFLEKSLKEIHEFLADQQVIKQNGQSDNYKKLLVARVFGINPGLFSFFNYSLIKNRLAMMTKEKSPFYKRFKYLLVLPLLVFLAYILACENKTIDETLTSPMQLPSPSNSLNANDTTFAFVDEKATFQGGSLEIFAEWIQKNLVYPPLAIENNISGRVVISFVVNVQGKITDIKILKSPDDMLTKEVLRIINKSPDWEAGKIGKQKVNQQFVIPVIFQLD